jgi:HK97 family phage major capsid protein
LKEKTMVKISDLLEARSGALATMRSLLTSSETENRDLTAEEDSKFKSLKAEVSTLDGRIERARALADAERAAPAILHNGRGDGNFEDRARKFSVVKAIASAMGERSVDAGFELEISAEAERRMGRAGRGQFVIPDAYFEEKRTFGDNVMLTSGVGATLVPNVHRDDLFINRLRAALVVGRLGATVVDGLVGTVEIPKQTGSATAAWVAEDGAMTDTALAFSEVNLTPKTVYAITSYSRRMLLNTVPSIENIVRGDLAAIIANEVDKKALIGDGTSNTPTGVVFQSGVSEVFFENNPDMWATILKFISTIQNQDADVGSLAWAMSPDAVAKFRSTLKVQAGTTPGYLMDTPDNLAGYPVAVTTALGGATGASSPSTEQRVIFGAWSQMLIGQWGGTEVLVNPYADSAYQKGRTLVRIMKDIDVQVRYGQSFAFAEDLEVA